MLAPSQRQHAKRNTHFSLANAIAAAAAAGGSQPPFVQTSTKSNHGRAPHTALKRLNVPRQSQSIPSLARLCPPRDNQHLVLFFLPSPGHSRLPAISHGMITPPSECLLSACSCGQRRLPETTTMTTTTASSPTPHRTQTVQLHSLSLSYPTQHQYKIKMASVQSSPEYTATSSPQAEKSPFCTSRSDLHHAEFSVSSPPPTPLPPRSRESVKVSACRRGSRGP